MNTRIDPLTSVRFFAALSVVLYHVADQLVPLTGSGFFYRFLMLGYTGVPFFFFLSGFVLALAYLSDTRDIRVRHFYRARFARIYPLLFVCLTLDAPHTLKAVHAQGQLTASHVAQAFAVSYTAMEGWFPHTLAFDGPSWSITVEAFFYLLFPFLAPFLWRLSRMATIYVALATYVTGALVVFYLVHWHINEFAADLSPPTHMFVFVLGILLARMYVSRANNPGWSVPMEEYAPAVLIGCLLVYICVPFFDLHIPKIVVGHGLFVPLYAPVILALGSGNRWVDSLFSARWLVVLGEASFALYLLHDPVSALLRRWTESLGVLGVILYVFLCIGLSVASFYFLEGPSRRWIMRRPLPKFNSFASSR